MNPADSPYPRPITSVDLVIFGLGPDGLAVLVMRRAAEPFADHWALPGGWIHVDEDGDLDAAARRVLRDKTGVETPYLEQLQSFGNATRDPRGWTVSVAYMALIAADEVVLRQGASASDVAWWPVSGAGVEGALAFDHPAILATGLARLRNKVEYTSLPVHLLPDRFTLPDLQSVYERILGRRIDKSAFRKRIAEADFVEPVPGEKRPASNRPAQIYRVRPGQGTIFFDRVI
jgi:ADP-ribose pyrophosphatase YjhB (NUDIX family)